MVKAWDLPSAFPFACFSKSRGPRFDWTMRSSNADRHVADKLRTESFYIDKRGKLRTFDHKRLSRKRGDGLRGKGWKYGFSFVDGVFPVLSPIVQQLLGFLREIGEWILHKSSFRSDVMCYNLLIDAYGEKSLYQKGEKAYLELMEMRCIPTEDTYALLLKAYCACNLLEKAEAVILEMRKHGLRPSASR